MGVYKRDQKGNIYSAELESKTIFTPMDEDDVPGQTTFDSDGFVHDNAIEKEIEADDGHTNRETAVELLNKNFNPAQFFNLATNQADKALEILLSMQSNLNPLKKGGINIAYKSDALILATRSQYTTEENLVFDILLGEVSSHPDNEAYAISFDRLKPYLNKGEKYVKKMLNEATDSLGKKNYLELEILQPNGTCKVINFPWHNGLIYTKKGEFLSDEKESADCDVIGFNPTPIFKALAVSSTITHGAHYSISLSSQFKGYTRALFYLFESKKRYKENPGSIPGRFYMSVEELRNYLNLPSSYATGDISNKILKVAKTKFSTAENIDFTFDYVSKSIGGKSGKKIKGYNIILSDLFEAKVVKKDEPQIPEKEDTNYVVIKGMLEPIGVKSNKIDEIYAAYLKNNRDMKFFSEAYTKAMQKKRPADYLLKLIENGFFGDDEQSSRTAASSAKTKFNNFEERKTDMQELEDMLVLKPKMEE